MILNIIFYRIKDFKIKKHKKLKKNKKFKKKENKKKLLLSFWKVLEFIFFIISGGVLYFNCLFSSSVLRESSPLLFLYLAKKYQHEI